MEHALQERIVLILDDDQPFVASLSNALQARGYIVAPAGSVREALLLVDRVRPDYGVIDLRLGDGNGLDVIRHLNKTRPGARAIVLTGYGNIETAVAAVKSGAVDYLTKPADVEEILSALQATGSGHAEVPARIIPPNEARLDHIVRFWRENHYDVSGTARQLGMHRRTLQRILRRQGLRRPSQTGQENA